MGDVLGELAFEPGLFFGMSDIDEADFKAIVLKNNALYKEYLAIFLYLNLVALQVLKPALYLEIALDELIDCCQFR